MPRWEEKENFVKMKILFLNFFQIKIYFAPNAPNLHFHSPSYKGQGKVAHMLSLRDEPTFL